MTRQFCRGACKLLLIFAIFSLVACGDDTTTTPAPQNGGDAGGDMGPFDLSEFVCGDGVTNGDETCDDGNVTAGDGCSSTCQVEDGWICTDAGCMLAEACGNGVADDGEGCDDGNTDAGDGCSDTCSLEAGWVCPTAGEACMPAGCGDGFAVDDEECDDNNMNDGDGCSAACEVEDGWVCVGATDCIAQQCGDGIVAGDEACDDGNADAGDGCAADCLSVEPNFICTNPGMACESTVVCGNRRVEPGEECDDGNMVSGDGCTMCQREAGWVCPVPGARCRAEMCGDGIVVDNEQCDDMNNMAGDGCSPTCQIEQGWACPPGMACFETTCGDGMQEGTEQCDDGNTRPFDGCSQNCTNEPDCGGGTCTAICGDGVILPGPMQEACDDGNTRDGDGCSSTCTIEDGWTCTVQPDPLPTTLELPLVIRDFKGIEWYADNTTQYGHPDFNDPNDGNGSISFGIVEPLLGMDGRPVLAYQSAPGSDGTGLPKEASRFAQWYDSSSPWNREEIRFLSLTRPMASTTFSYDSTVQGYAPNSTSGFYPIDNGGWVAQGSEALRTANATANDGGDHNFNFTTETRFFFQYQGDEILAFSGDDDLWVFIDGVLCLDVGGLHPELGATMNLDDPTQESNATQRAIVQNCKNHLDGLVTAMNPEPLVEMVIFHAERHTTASNFELELTGFVTQSSSCVETCGDGVVTAGEVCDDGVNDGSYNGCSMDCLSFGGFCGDMTVEGPEECDLGVNDNDGTYGGCNPDCTNAGVCGDAVVQPRNEVCDDGVNDGSYGSCSADCQMRAAFCGDGTINGPEECDQGLGANLGEYGGCNPDCTNGPFCGDGVRQGDEECDDGNGNDADGCTRECEKPIL